MSNYGDEPYYLDNIYTNTYNLWQNSIYYDINNLSPQNFSSSWHRGNDEDFETRYTSGPTEAQAAEPPKPRDYKASEPPEPPDHRTSDSPYYNALKGPDYTSSESPCYQILERPGSKLAEPPYHKASVPPDHETSKPSYYEALKRPEYRTSGSPYYKILQRPNRKSSYYNTVELVDYNNLDSADNKIWKPMNDNVRRTIEKRALYEDHVMFYQDMGEENSTPPPVSVWIPPQWRDPMPDFSLYTCNTPEVRPRRIQKRYDKMSSKPVKTNIAESMMRRMGWPSVPRGLNGTRIIEPIAPDTTYATKKAVFGPVRDYTAQKKENFAMNVLYNIYEFVKNNSEVELYFDRGLSREERKRIHNMVQLMNKVENMSVVNYESTAQLDLVVQICEVNCYVLQTQCEGEHPYRQLYIYKEAPEHVYLIIPDDLREPPTDDPSVEPDSTDGVAAKAEPEEETNPFLKSITRNLQKMKIDDEKDKKTQQEELPKKKSVFEKIIQYFSEFAANKQYTELKFLGSFAPDEVMCIHAFMENALQYLYCDTSDIRHVFVTVSFEISEDVTGNTIIKKMN